jgi:hypothetical protein
MKLQRYDLWVDAHRVEIVADADNEFGTWVKASDVAELESALCETCKDPACEDSRLAYYVSKAIKAGERIGMLEKENKKFREILIAKNARCPACDKWERAREFLGLPWKQYPDELKKIFEESAE